MNDVLAFATQITDSLKLSNEIIIKIALSFLLLLFVIITRKIIINYLQSRVKSSASIYRIQKISSIVFFIIIIVFLTIIWISFSRGFITILSLLSAGIAIASKDIIMDIAGWIYLISAKPFELGDRIEIGEVAGDVVDIRLFKFTLMEIGKWVASDQSTGRIIHVPNTDIFNKSIANYSKGFFYIWDELAITITFSSNWKKAKEILTNIVDEYAASMEVDAQQGIREASKKIMIHYNKLTPIVYTSVIDYGITLTLRYLTPPRNRRSNQQKIWEQILDMFLAHNDIKIAYPATRVKLDTANVMTEL